MSESGDYFLCSERIGFRDWTVADSPLALRLWAEPRVTGLIADLGQPSEEQAQARLMREMGNREKYGVQYWPMFRRVDEEFLGCCGLRPYRPERGIFEIGAHLLPEQWGQGYATEAMRCVMAYAFGMLALRALFGRHNPKNEGSRRIVARLGFRYTHDDFLPQTGLNHPAYLLRAEEFAVLSRTESRSQTGVWERGNVGEQPDVVLRAEDPAHPEVRRLIEELDAYQSAIYPPESLHLTPIELLRKPAVTFLAACVDGKIAGCGAMVNHGDYVELKRMYVVPGHRGLGIGRRLLDMLEARARCLGLSVARLETGVSQPEALRLYERAGYQRRGPFGEYLPDALTVYMEKKLEPWRD